MKGIENLIVWYVFRRGLKHAQKRIWSRWKKAKAVFGDAVGFGLIRPFENRLISLIIQRFPDDALFFFKQGLAHENPNVVGYSLLGIVEIDRDLLHQVTIPQSDRKVTWCWGCVGTDGNLDQLKKAFSER